jgi:hypothetical protein
VRIDVWGKLPVGRTLFQKIHSIAKRHNYRRDRVLVWLRD